ncbi:hypothetical protein GCM10010988_39990 [Cnuibacter physcomitrellae]|uniref:hypothetical protein n=1 Tax=Cnuibacter physcomitrellae TaxID=1619308 RepID=UPI00157BC41A|nr:hypothetical protein [Cnuibacter physcomitrellae]GGI42628.1 hypothetical protein GCM10010988_39990 [Cnuibacter physcomitrellae]
MSAARESTAPPPLHTKWGVAVGMGIAAAAILVVVILAFLWPSKTSGTHNLPVSIAGPAESVSALEAALGTSDTFEFVSAADRDQAVDQIQTRETYGAIVLGATAGTAPEVLTAPAASPVSAQLLSGVASQLQAQLAKQVAAAGGDPSSVTVTVTPVVPLSASDPTGAGLAAAAFPLAIGGMIGGILISLLVVGPLRRLAAVAGFAVVSGIATSLVMQTWFEYLQGDFWLNALAMGLTMLATASFIIGCTSLLGRAGIAVGAITTMFIGNPLSAAATPWQFLPEPWGVVGQYLVPGASNSLLRTLSYFPDANAAQQWWTLTAWAALGVVLTLAGHFRSRASMRVAPSSLEEGAPRRTSVEQPA